VIVGHPYWFRTVCGIQ